MKEKFVTLIYAICLIITVTSCTQNDQPAEDNVNTSKTSEALEDTRNQPGEAEAVTAGSGLSEQEILATLNDCDSFFDCFAPSGGFTATSIQINHRNTENEGTDEIYANVTSVNEYSSFTAEFHIHYKYYDEGGWRLESLQKNNNGTYLINYWPQEADLYAVWDSIYSKQYEDGVIEAYEITSTGNDYVMFLVEYSISGKIATKYQKAEVRFGFENGEWSTFSMAYPGEPEWKLHSDAVRGLYMGTSVNGDFMRVVIMNIYSADSGRASVKSDFYEYTVDKGTYHVDFSAYPQRDINFASDFVKQSISGSMQLTDGTWYYDKIPMESFESFSDTPLTEEDARSMIQSAVENSGFSYWDSLEDAQAVKAGELQNKAQAEWEKLLQDESIAAYRPAFRTL